MKIGVVNFLNAFPLYYGLDKITKPVIYLPDSEQLEDFDSSEKPDNEITLIKAIPSELSKKMQQHQLDIALVSSIEYYRNKEKWNYVPSLCIASDGAVDSIRLFLNENIQNIKNIGANKPQEYSSSVTMEIFNQITTTNDIVIIYYDEATRSSLAMLQILLLQLYTNVEMSELFQFKEIQRPFDARVNNLKPNELLLLIGDEALRHKQKPSIDLGQLYSTTFNRSMIYALWTYPKDNPAADYSFLQQAYHYSLNNWDAMLDSAVETFGFDLAYTKNYLQNSIHYNLDEKRTADLDFYFSQYERL